MPPIGMPVICSAFRSLQWRQEWKLQWALYTFFSFNFFGASRQNDSGVIENLTGQRSKIKSTTKTKSYESKSKSTWKRNMVNCKMELFGQTLSNRGRDCVCVCMCVRAFEIGGCTDVCIQAFQSNYFRQAFKHNGVTIFFRLRRFRLQSVHLIMRLLEIAKSRFPLLTYFTLGRSWWNADTHHRTHTIQKKKHNFS